MWAPASTVTLLVCEKRLLGFAALWLAADSLPLLPTAISLFPRQPHCTARPLPGSVMFHSSAALRRRKKAPGKDFGSVKDTDQGP